VITPTPRNTICAAGKSTSPPAISSKPKPAALQRVFSLQSSARDRLRDTGIFFAAGSALLGRHIQTVSRLGC
jgi:hypothetical protein